MKFLTLLTLTVLCFTLSSGHQPESDFRKKLSAYVNGIVRELENHGTCSNKVDSVKKVVTDLILKLENRTIPSQQFETEFLTFFHGICPTANTYRLSTLAQDVIKRVENKQLSRTISERNFEETFNRIKKENKDLSDYEVLVKVNKILNPDLELQSDVESDIESDVESVADQEDVVSEVGSENDVADDAASLILKQYKHGGGKSFDDLYKEDPIKHEEPVVEPVPSSTPKSPRSPRSPRIDPSEFNGEIRNKLVGTGHNLWNETA